MKRILIMGANGFIGTQLVKKLVLRNIVIGYDLKEPDSEICKNANFIYCKGDYLKDDFNAIFERYKPNLIIHLISTTTPREGTDILDKEVQQNVLPMIKVLEAMRSCGIKRLIYASSGGTVYGDWKKAPYIEDDVLKPICGYGIQKATIESYIRLYKHMYDLNPLVVRISNPYGVCNQIGRKQGIIPIFINKLLEGEAITLYGDTIRDYIAMEDVVEAIEKLTDYNGTYHTFNVGAGYGERLSDVVVAIEKIVGKNFIKVNHEKLRNCDVEYNVLDTSRILSELNWKSKYNLEEGIRKVYEEMVNEK